MLCFVSLEMLWERSEPRRGWLFLAHCSQKNGLGDRFRGLAQDELSLSIVPLVANMLGTQSLEEKSKDASLGGEGVGVLQREPSLCLEYFFKLNLLG